MIVQCQICNLEFTIGRLQLHVAKVHNINIEEYYSKYINNDPIDKKCPMCDKQRKFIGFSSGYAITCCDKSCKAKYINSTYKENQIQGCKERNKKWKEEIVDGKTKQQIIISRGDELRKHKQEQTSIKISKALKEIGSDGLTPLSRSFMENYSVINPMKLPEVVLKLRQTFRKDHGVEWITQSELVKQKIRETIFDKQGVYNWAQSKEAKDELRIRYKDRMFKRIEQYFESNDLSLIGDISEIYQNEKTALKYKCNKCNNEYENCWNDIMSWWVCRQCHPYSNSSYEDELDEYLNQFNIQFLRTQSIIKNPVTGRMLELDFYFPDLKIAIEFDGLYWHSNEHQLNDTYHLMKTELCEQQGIRLIHIFEDEWVLKKNIVLSRLSNLLHISNLVKIHARKCIIKPIDFLQKTTFLTENHIQGNDVSSVNLGLFFNDILVSVMTFSKGSISKGNIKEDGVYELSRFSNLCFHSISGSASKLLAYFKNNYEWKKIFSYADRRWSQGNVYHKLGFRLESTVGINYWYMNRQDILHRIHRFTFRKSMLIKKDGYIDTLTEKENMKNMGYIWIYDCGNLKFVIEK